MSEEKKEFVVKDRRFFSEEGKDKEKLKTEKPPEAGKTKAQPAGKGPEQDNKQAAQKAQAEASAGASVSEKASEEETQLPEINFVTFVLSLNASALVNLGLVEDPASNTKVKNLPLAKQTIDILGMLQDKTRGNLSADEENLIKHVLYELRMIYVREKK
ncbi:MAG: DUF1844 domain-containing protein [Thermodesulfobacteriota bacterium]